ncbi:MFS transporter [Caloramator sp.]|jgi:oligogalacturonide transporter|uniref:MFS transporter n=1 Tax=Caloramator sp. TaxID=1871330 RepID=UPI0025BEB41E|nr:MFS transporter [Caloramator sp.]
MEKDFKRKLMYGCGDIFGGGAFLLISLLFLNYLTDVELINPALAGIIMLIGKIWDAVSDPLMGVLSDRTKSKYGRRRVYFLFGSLPIFISFSLMWYSFGINKNYLFAYYLFVYLLFNTAFTMVMIPYNSILPEMVKDYQERTSYTGVRLIFSITSAILAGVVPKIIVNSFGTSVKTGYMVMGIAFAVLYSLPWFIVFKGTYEEKEHIISNENPFNELIQVFRNRSFRIYSGIFISCQTAVDFLTTLFIYYLTSCIKRPSEFPIVLGTLLVTQLIVMPINIKVAKKYTKTTPLKFGFTMWIIALITSIFLNPSSPKFLVYLVAALSGFGTSVSVLVPWSILPEIADVDEIITKKRREGVYAGMATLLRKLANGITIAFIGFMLQIVGYKRPTVVGEYVEQSSSTIIGIKILFSIVPIIFILLTLYFASKYAMTQERHKILQSEIERLKMGGKKEEAKEETKKICKELTGIDYNNLWC